MPKKASKAGVNKTEMTRQYVAKYPTAGIKEIVDALKAEGVKISRSLAGKIKYGASGPKKGRRSQKPGLRATSGNGAERGSKAEAIRSAARSIGKKLRPRDVIAMLQEQGIVVTSAQVSTTLKQMGMRRTRRGRRPQVAAAAIARKAPPSSDRVSLDNLIAAKRLVEKLGGIEQAKTAIWALAKLS